MLQNRPSKLTKEEFLHHFSGIYENSAWVAELLWSQLEVSVERNCFDSAAAVASQMKIIVKTATNEEQLELLRSHPDLAGKAALAGELTEESTKEQASAGLDQCTPDELVKFQQLNGEYQEKFGFPFIMAVKGATKTQILDNFVERLKNTATEEFNYALNEVHKIAAFRLAEK